MDQDPNCRIRHCRTPDGYFGKQHDRSLGRPSSTCNDSSASSLDHGLSVKRKGQDQYHRTGTGTFFGWPSSPAHLYSLSAMAADIPVNMFTWRKHKGSPTPVWEEVPVPKPDRHEILVKMLASGGTLMTAD